MSSPNQPPDETRRLLGSLPEQALLRIVTECARVGLVVVGPDRRYLYVNAVYTEILDLPSQDLIGRRLPDVLAGIYEEQVRPRLDRGFAGERVGYTLRKPTAEGDRYYAVRYEPVAVDGAITQVVVVITDITEHRQTEAESSRFAAIVESSDDAIVGKDLEGTVTSWNRGAERLFGYSADEMVGTSIERLIPAGRQAEEREILEKIRRNEHVRHFETLRRTKAGALVDVSVTISPIKDAAGNVVGASKVARDISERKRAEEERRFQQAMLLTERELTLDGILVVDAHSTILSFNRRFAEMWGVSTGLLETRADEILLQAVRDKLRDPERFMDRIRELYDHHDEASEDEVELADGRVFERYSAPMRDAEGEYYGRVWYFRDVTGSKQVEAALREERDRAQRFLDTAEVILLALDARGRVTVINRKGCEILGYSEAELLGRDWIATCLPPRTHGDVARKLESLLEGDLSTVENPVLTKDGRERLIAWRNRVLRDDDGRVVGTFSSGTDITEQHQAAEALRTAEERMRFALESAGVGIWDLDYTTGAVRMSEILEAHYGLEPGTFGGTLEAFIEAVHPEDRAAVRATLEKAVESGADFSSVHRALWPDGTVRWLDNAGRIHLDAAGRPVRGVGIAMDVTERRTLEAQYHQAQKMEAVGRLAGGVAHDFNNLLTAILGYCELLLADLGPGDPRRDDILEIQKAGETAAGLTRQLLAFSRKQIIEPALLDLNEVIGGMRGMLGRLIGEDVEVALELAPGLAPVLADRGQLEQIVLNLAVNARDAMPRGGKLTIETRGVELDGGYARLHRGVEPGSYVGLGVSDTGTGMSPEVQARLFEPFFTTKEPGKGTGLGLATVHGIVTRIGGSIGVYSEVGRGTSITVYLPQAASAEETIRPPPPAPRPRPSGETVLVVEDSDALRELTRRMLEQQGYEVLLAADAGEAREQFERSASIDLILSDVVLPGDSGPELARGLVERRPGLKVVFMSGYTEDAITHHGVLEAGVAFLHKPFTSEALARKVREVLDR